MKMYKHILEEIVTDKNMRDSFDQVVSEYGHKERESYKRILADEKNVIKLLQKEISEGTFKVDFYNTIEIQENDKIRKVDVVPLIKRIGINAIMRVVEQRIYGQWIRTTGASIKKRGTCDQLRIILRDIHKHPEETRYAYQGDIIKFYESIPQEFMMSICRKYFSQEKLLKMLHNFITLLPKGLSIGLRSSQGLGNLLLSVVLDHWLKDKLGVKFYYRYCDNILILDGSKKRLWKLRNEVVSRVGYADLRLHANERVFPISTGIDTLGWVIYPDHVLLRKRNKQKFARRWKKVKSKKRKKELLGSFYSIAKHCNSVHLFRTITKMTSFKELGLKYVPKDGKKRFKGRIFRLREIVNVKVEVTDYELEVPTQHGPRCLVKVRRLDNNDEGKFFTSSEEMIYLLKAADEKQGIPFETTIASESYGDGKVRYYFT